MALVRFAGGISSVVRRKFAGIFGVQTRRMIERREFRPLQAEEIARAFHDEQVEYLFIGKSGAILLGYPGTTQDVDVFPRKDIENGRRIVSALAELGFEID